MTQYVPAPPGCETLFYEVPVRLFANSMALTLFTTASLWLACLAAGTPAPGASDAALLAALHSTPAS